MHTYSIAVFVLLANDAILAIVALPLGQFKPRPLFRLFDACDVRFPSAEMTGRPFFEVSDRLEVDGETAYLTSVGRFGLFPFAAVFAYNFFLGFGGFQFKFGRGTSGRVLRCGRSHFFTGGFI